MDHTVVHHIVVSHVLQIRVHFTDYSLVYQSVVYHSLVYHIVHCVSKKVPTFELSVTLSYLNRFSKILHCWKAYEICYQTRTTLPTSHLTLGMLLHYLGKLKIQIFCRYSADMEENANKLHSCGH